MIDGFAAGHPAQNHIRSQDRLEEAFFGKASLGYVLFAEEKATVIGFGIWRKTYDVFWSMYGGEGIGLYVKPSRRGFGVAIAIVAAMCKDIRQEGGQFIETSYSSDLAGLYERIGVGRDLRACHVSAAAFEELAALAGRAPREIIRALPAKTLNFVSLPTTVLA